MESTVFCFRYLGASLVCACILFACNVQKQQHESDGDTGSTILHFSWGADMPESQGMSSERLFAARDTLAAKNTQALLVIRNDHIVLEWYAPGHHPRRRQGTASLAKATVGGMSLALAMHDGRLKADDPAWKHIPEWKNDPKKSLITIRQLATHSSGVEDSEIYEDEMADAKAKGIELKTGHMEMTGWKGDFWRQTPDPFSISRDHAPVRWTPGTEYHYSNPGMALLSYAVTSSFQGTPWPDVRTLLGERIMKPLGIQDDEWAVGYGKTFEVNGMNMVANWGGAAFTPRAAARIGRLMLRHGNWEGQLLIDAAVVNEVLQYKGDPLPPRDPKQPSPASGLAWYNNFDSVWPKAPKDTFSGAGANNQVLIVMPSLNLIIVRNGRNMFDETQGEGFWFGIEKYLVNGVLEAIVE